MKLKTWLTARKWEWIKLENQEKTSKRKVAGIVAEYNPIHNGHTFHLEKTREDSKADFVIAVISGNFTQRGEPAILDKWTRAKMAVENGVDLVLEIPTAYACNSAEHFAYGGVRVLESLGVVTDLAFGTEAKNIADLQKVANILARESQTYKENLKAALDQGKSFAKSRELAILKELEKKGTRILDPNVIREPNNILAIEYLKALKRLKSNINPLPIERRGESHQESATQIRSLINQGDFNGMQQFVSKETALTIKLSKSILDEENKKNYFDLIRYAILSKEGKYISTICACSEGLENRLKAKVRYGNSIEELVKLVKSKRYTETRINRLFAQLVLGITEKELKNVKDDFYTRVLAFNPKGGKLLKEIKGKTSKNIKIIEKINKGTKLHKSDIMATDIYNITFAKDLYTKSDFVEKPYIIKEKL